MCLADVAVQREKILRPKIFTNGSSITNFTVINFTNCLTFILSSIRVMDFIFIICLPLVKLVGLESYAIRLIINVFLIEQKIISVEL